MRSKGVAAGLRSALALLGVLALGAGQFEAAIAAKPPKRVLVTTVTKGWRHESIPTAERVIEGLARTSGAFTVDFARTDDELRAKTAPGALASYDAVVFAHTTGDLPLADREAFLTWIKAGHGFVGIHSASDTFHSYSPFIAMLGGEFDYHKEQATVSVIVEDGKHPAAKGLASPFSTHDEIYILKNFTRADVHMILALDKHPNTGEAGYYPLAWSRDYGKGRVFYTALGHREDVLESEWYGRHLLGGILWALGEAKAGR